MEQNKNTPENQEEEKKASEGAIPSSMFSAEPPAEGSVTEGIPPQTEMTTPPTTPASAPEKGMPMTEVAVPEATTAPVSTPEVEKGAPMTEVAAAVSEKKEAPKKAKIKSAGLGAKGTPKKKVKPAAAASAQPLSVTEEQQKAMRSPLGTTIARNEFYRDGFRKLLGIAILEGCIIVTLILSFIVYMNVVKPQDRYFATTADGRIMRLTPLDRPNMSQAALMSWVSQASIDVMTFGFHDYQKRLQESSKYFTRRGWESFTNALQSSRIIEGVENTQQIVTAAPQSAPVIVQEGIMNGKYRWIVELPLMVTYQSGAKSKTDLMRTRLTLERVPTLESEHGVGIEQWISY